MHIEQNPRGPGSKLGEGTEISRRGFLLKAELLRRAIEGLFLKNYPAQTGKVEFTIQGSVAKNTFVGTPDIDIFVLCKKENFQNLQSCILKSLKFFKGEKKYIKQQYISITFWGENVDLVPCVGMDGLEKSEGDYDATQLHTQFINKNLDENQKKQVRNLKILFQRTRNYSSCYCHGGVKGFFLEVLMHRLKTKDACLEFLRGGANLKEDIFTDPLNDKRNLLSPIEPRILERIRIIAENPSCEDFFLQEEDIHGLTIGKKFLLFNCTWDSGSNILSSQILKIESILFKNLSPFGLRNISWVPEGGNSLILVIEYLLEESSFVIKRQGPKIKRGLNQFIEGKRIVFDPWVSCLEIFRGNLLEETCRALNMVKSIFRFEHRGTPLNNDQEGEVFMNSKSEWFSESMK